MARKTVEGPQPLTSEMVERLEAPASGYSRTWDAGKGAITGFGVRVTKAGTKSYIYNYRTRHGRQRCITLGQHPEMTASQARKLAKRYVGQVAEGADPLATLAAGREAQARTFETLSKLYQEHLRERTTPPTERTLRLYQRDYLDRWLLPAFGKRAVTEVTRHDLKTLHRKITSQSGPYLANRVLALAHGIAKYGDTIGWWPGGRYVSETVDRNRERARNAERAVMLDADEVVQEGQPRKRPQLRRLLDVLDETERKPGAHVYALACVRFLLWSGWRPEEAFNLRWEDLDLANGRAKLTRTKTRVDGEERVLLAEAVAVLKRVPRILGYPYVFAGNKPRQPLTHVNRTWRSLRKAAGLEDLGGNLGPMRLRDLRHNYIAMQINNGVDLGMVGRMVGHKNRQTTARYGGFAPDVLRSLGDAALRAVREELSGG